MNSLLLDASALRLGRILLALLLICFLGGCVTNFSQPVTPNSAAPGLICHNAGQWRGQVIGDGHCVSLIKHCTDAPRTSAWKPGKKARGENLVPGTIIATFEGQLYPSKTGYHAAIYSSQDQAGVWVWDQWQGKPVHRRLIRWQNKSSSKANQGNAYRVVILDQAP